MINMNDRLNSTKHVLEMNCTKKENHICVYLVEILFWEKLGGFFNKIVKSRKLSFMKIEVIIIFTKEEF